MQLIKEINHKDVSNSQITQPVSYNLRKASRAILINDKNEVALMHVVNRNFYKLPGGGVEDDEDIKQTLEREVKEETGCSAKILNEIGVVIEYRDELNFMQISYCFACQITSYNKSNLTEKEIKDGFVLEFLDLDTAIQKMKEAIATIEEYHGKFITRRDLAFLEEYKIQTRNPKN